MSLSLGFRITRLVNFCSKQLMMRATGTSVGAPASQGHISDPLSKPPGRSNKDTKDIQAFHRTNLLRRHADSRALWYHRHADSGLCAESLRIREVLGLETFRFSVWVLRFRVRV